MKTFTISAAFAFLAALSHAAPAPTEITARSYSGYEAQVTFYGAADAEFSLSIPADGRLITITNPLSVSKIQLSGYATCVFNGIDGSVTFVVGPTTVDVGPPQTQISGFCRAL